MLLLLIVLVEAAVAEAAAAAAVPAPAPAPALAAVQVQASIDGSLLQMPPVKTLPVTSEAATRVGDVVVCCTPGRVDDMGPDCLADLNRVVKAFLRRTLGVDSLHVRTVPDMVWSDLVREVTPLPPRACIQFERVPLTEDEDASFGKR